MSKIPLAALLTLVSLVACPSTTHAASAPESDTPADLLKNLKIAWDKRLLVQPAFWSDEALRQFLHADSVEWNIPNTNGPPEFPPEIEFVRYRGSGSAHRSLLPATITISRWFQRDPPGPVTPGNPHPGHEESAGGLDFAFGPGVTWSVVRELFGPGYVLMGPPPPPNMEYWPGRPVTAKRSKHVAPEKPESTAAEPQTESAPDQFSVCYLAPQGMPYQGYTDIQFWPGDQICFGLQPGTKPLSQHEGRYDPEIDDRLIYVHLVQQLGHIPIECNRTPVDPSWRPWCPPN